MERDDRLIITLYLTHIFREKFTPDRVYNIDKTGMTTVQNPHQILAEMGTKRWGQALLVIVVCAIKATGNSIPLMFIFPSVNYKDHFIKSRPTGSIGSANSSGWIYENLFCTFLQHIRVVELAKENGVIMLTIAPHTLHKLQHLDKSVFGPMRKYYNRAMDACMRSNPGNHLYHSIISQQGIFDRIYSRK